MQQLCGALTDDDSIFDKCQCAWKNNYTNMPAFIRFRTPPAFLSENASIFSSLFFIHVCITQILPIPILRICSHVVIAIVVLCQWPFKFEPLWKQFKNMPAFLKRWMPTAFPHWKMLPAFSGSYFVFILSWNIMELLYDPGVVNDPEYDCSCIYYYSFVCNYFAWSCPWIRLLN